jgi:hypothetical protein
MQRRQSIFVDDIDELKNQIRQWSRVIKALRIDIREWEHDKQSEKLRQDIAAITSTAEIAKLKVVRSALITTRSLPHINCRPSAWWLPVVDPSGAWFDAISEGTTTRLEPV